MDESITPGKYIFTTLDCMTNRVALKKETYDSHIIAEHDEITPTLMKYCVESAHQVYTDEIPNRYDYYKLILNPVKEEIDLVLLKVVVEATKNEYAEIVTSHLMRKIKHETTGGRLVYDAGSSSSQSGIQFQI